jgi:predicted RNA methylase
MQAVSSSTSRSLILIGKFRAASRRGGLRPLFRALRHAAEELVFDLYHGVDTTSLWTAWGVPEGYDSAKFVHYAPSKIAHVIEALSGLDIDYAQSTFIDIGSGKGRILLLASRFPFRKIVGVEFHPRLCKIAKNNLRKYRRAQQKCRDIEVYCADATVFPLPQSSKLVFYLFNPFGAVMVEKFLNHLGEALYRSQREVWVIYHYPVHRALMMQCGFLETVKTEEEFSVFRHLPASADSLAQAGETPPQAVKQDGRTLRDRFASCRDR